MREDDDWGPDFDTDEEAEAHNSIQDFERQRKQQALEHLYEQLAQYGAREERPYEHWNEDEGYMAYMERDRD